MVLERVAAKPKREPHTQMRSAPREINPRRKSADLDDRPSQCPVRGDVHHFVTAVVPDCKLIAFSDLVTVFGNKGR